MTKMSILSINEAASSDGLALVRPSRRNLILLAALILVALAYFPLNSPTAHFHTLTTGLDRDIPVVPVFAIPYLVFFPLFWLVVLYSFITDHGFVQLALTTILVYICSDLAYAIFQTFAPRPHVAAGGLLPELVRFIYAHDSPYNDFPSEHASSATMLALYSFAIGYRWRALVLVFAVVVISSTLLVKQHTIAGMIGGVSLAVVAWIAVSFVRARYLACSPE